MPGSWGPEFVFLTATYLGEWICIRLVENVIYTTAFLKFIFTLYLYEFQKRKEPQVINANKKWWEFAACVPTYACAS